MKKIGDILIEKGLISEETVKDILAEQELSLKKFGDILIEKNLIDENKLIAAVAEQNGYGFYENFEDAKIIQEKSDEFYWKNCCVLIQNNVDTVFVFNINNPEISSYITALSFKNIKFALSTKEKIYRFLSSNIEIKSTKGNADNLMNKINEALEIAIIKKSSNIRIKKNSSSYLILMDTDIGIETIKVFSLGDGEKIINIIAILCKTQLEYGRPLDAKFNYTSILSKKKVDIRVEFLPVSMKTDNKGYFEAVLRIHGLNSLLDLKALGFSKDERNMLREVLTYSSGLVLSAGPTGAGKSTTFYAILKELAKKRLPILTVEDPVEIKLNEINVSQMSIADDFRYNEALVAMLRCEPKIILVGEIRDKETAEAVLKAAQTGHLVLSTIHTRSALNIISRINGLGVNIDEFLEVIKLSTSQRLYLPLCPNCKEKKEISSLNSAWLKPLSRFGIYAYPKESNDACIAVNEIYTVARGKKCGICYGAGYLPKKAIIEILSFDEEIINNIKSGGKIKYETLTDKALHMLGNGQIDINQFFGIAG